MTWQPGQPVVSASDHEQRQAWRKARKRKRQRQARQGVKRIDYQPSSQVLAVLDARATRYVGGDYSTVIDQLILQAVDMAPELACTSRARA